MNKKLLSLFVAAACCSLYSFGQELDDYMMGTSNFTTIADASNGILNPQDLDFVPGKNVWWILNYEGQTGSVNIIYDAGKPTQYNEFRRDSHAGHFMPRPSAIAIGDNGNFATVQEVLTANPPPSTFTGPTLWSSDTAIFARLEQSDWLPTTLLGSHLDMLHQSPYAMGVAYDQGNAYWVFDGHNGNICHYDFKAPHIVGGDDHSDGEVLRYSDVSVKRKNGIPSHMAFDKDNNWLYIVDGGNNRIIRMKTNNATDAGALTVPNESYETLAKYRNMTGATVEVLVSSGLTSPCGIDYKDGRIIVSDNATGDIIIYNVTSAPAVEVGRINTGSVGIMGVRIDWDNRIWYVNRNQRKVVRIDNENVASSVNKDITAADFKVYPNPAKDVVYVRFSDNFQSVENTVRLYDMTGKVVGDVTSRDNTISFNTSGLAPGVYTVEVANNQARQIRKVVIR